MASFSALRPLATLAIFSLYVVGSFAAQCTGNPPTYNGLPCASTTRYWDGQMGACGCGTGNSNPFSWQWNYHTAAASQLLFDDSGSTWCGDGCGACYELTPTGDCTTNEGCVSSLTPITIMITNRCPYQGNEVWCPNPGNTNTYGYAQHFDLMDYNMNGGISALGWNNPVVTYKRVPCGSLSSPTCDDYTTCECSNINTATESNCNQGSADATSAPATQAPATQAPATQAPATQAPATQAPATQAPATQAPATQAPATQAPATQAPSQSGSSSSCMASISFALTSSWNGGGLVSMTVHNVGTSAITGVTFTLPGQGNNVQSWNVQAANEAYTLPSWTFPLAVGQASTAAGYTFTGSQPSAGSIVSVSC